MELFRITETFEVELNKEWILLIPEFANILKADKGSKGDSEGRKKALARRQFAYIYFMVDFKSPIVQWEYAERHEEAKRYADLTEEQVSSAVVQDARKAYQTLQYKAARSLKTLDAAKKGLDALDDYLNTVDFKAIDKQGKLLHSPKEFVTNLASLNKAYDELAKFEKRVFEELKESGTIRGTASLGDKEHRADNAAQASTGTMGWEEGNAPVESSTYFGDIAVLMNKVKEKQQDEETEEE